MQKRTFDTFASPSRLRLIQALMALLFLCILFMSFEIPLVFRTGFGSVSQTRPRTFLFVNEDEFADKDAPIRPTIPTRVSSKSRNRTVHFDTVSGLIFNETVFDNLRKDEFSELHKSAKQAWVMGKKIWDELKLGKWKLSPKTNVETPKNHSQSCPHSISLSGPKFREGGGIMVIPCGLTLGSHITLVGRPRWAHSEHDSNKLIVKDDGQSEIVSQFMMELQGLKVVDGEDPPRILHFNPRLKGDWSMKPVIEQNTCYRMQWGSALRCEGLSSMADEETVDGLVKCEKWIHDDDDRSVESKTTWWLKRLMGRTDKAMVDWPFPFAEDKLFVLTLRAGLEGYHVNVDGRHVTSFPYRTGFVLEDATGLAVNGDIDVHSVVAASLPTSHPSFAPQRHLEMLEKWQAPGRPHEPVELFIGILSAGNHFGERMAVRKSWMQHPLIKSLQVVARFFVALHEKEEVNLELKKEADYFGDMVIVPYMDNYDLVVLKTVAICEYGARTVVSKYIMKCDDDTFVRVDAVIEEAKKIEGDTDIYVGNMNYNHKPLRHGKWTVTFEEWPEEEYPPYANGPGYIVSYDIAQFIVSQFEKHKLRLFKMEDVSMGMWVEQFNSSGPVEYLHSAKFCQFGCIDDYYTAHYQSPRQMICLWDKLQQKGKQQCCNMR